MREVNLAGLDLDLLPALEALLRRRNVTLAADDVGLSQPAMSRALGRLRHLFGDPLLVRAAGGFVLTPKAEALAPRVGAALDGVRELFREPTFDPGGVRRTIRLVGADPHSVLLLPALAARLAREAPGIDLHLEPYSRDLPLRMERGQVDFAFALSTTPLPPGAISEPIGSDRLAVVTRRGHPHGNRVWTLADYSRYDHAAVSILGDGQSELDAALAAGGVARRISFVTPHFMAALAVVAVTDMVTTISEAMARRFADTFGLTVATAPLPEPGMTMTLVSHQLRATDPVLSWFRGVVREEGRMLFPDPFHR